MANQIERAAPKHRFLARLHYMLIALCDGVVLPLSYFILIESRGSVYEISLLVTGGVVFIFSHFIWLLNAIDYRNAAGLKCFIESDSRHIMGIVIRCLFLLLLALFDFLSKYVLLSGLLVMSLISLIDAGTILKKSYNTK